MRLPKKSKTTFLNLLPNLFFFFNLVIRFFFLIKVFLYLFYRTSIWWDDRNKPFFVFFFDLTCLLVLAQI